MTGFQLSPSQPTNHQIAQSTPATSDPPVLLQQNATAEEQTETEDGENEETPNVTEKDAAEILIAVVLCMLLVVVSIRCLAYYRQRNNYTLGTVFHETSTDKLTNAWHAVVNACIVISVVILMSFLFAKLFKYECQKVISGWLDFANLLVLFGVFFEYVRAVLAVQRFVMDIITPTVFIWNFGAVGMVSMKGYGPCVLRQLYLVAISALAALMIIRHMPDWTTFAFLVALSLWDVVNIMWARGPFRKIERALQRRRQEPYLGLLFPAGTPRKSQDQTQMPSEHTAPRQMTSGPPAGTGREVSHVQAPNTEHLTPSAQALPRDVQQSIQVGVLDFVFYSVLVGKAAYYGDWISTLACCVGTLIGLIVTLSLLSVQRKNLPALLLSVFLGLLAFFICRTLELVPCEAGHVELEQGTLPTDTGPWNRSFAFKENDTAPPSLFSN